MADDSATASGYGETMGTQKHDFDDFAKQAAITRAGALKLLGSALFLAFVPLKQAGARTSTLRVYCDPGTLENCVIYQTTDTGIQPAPLSCVGQPQSIAICTRNSSSVGCLYQSTGQDPAGRLADLYYCRPPSPRCRRRRPCRRR